MASKLPSYKGHLGAAPWSAVRLTSETVSSLRGAALRGCPACGGRGFSGGPEIGHPCHCVNRPPDSTDAVR